MNDLYVYLPVLVFAALTSISAFFWWVMVRRPDRWSRWVDRENDFWVRKGWSTPEKAERVKKLEKGPIPKMLAATATVAGALGFIIMVVYLIRIAAIEHQNLKLPYHPVLAPQPLKPPPPKSPAKPASKKPPVKPG